MTPENKIKWAIIAQYEQCEKDIIRSVHLTEEEVEELWDEYSDDIYDYKYEFREGEVETNIPSDYSRHYESNSVAAQCPNEAWVGWTYWYGGGKHGDPESIDWMEYAYDLECVEEQKLVTIQTFTKKVESK